MAVKSNFLSVSVRLVLLLFFIHALPAEATQPCGVLEHQATQSRGTLAEGTEWETDYFVIDSGADGPTVLLIGGMHGNEPSGSRAAAQILHWPITKGKMVVVPRANVLGLEANTRSIPGQPEESENLNRNFPQEEQNGEEHVMPRGELATSLWSLAIETQPDWVIDLHEGYEFNRSHNPPEGKKKSVGSSVIYQGGPRMDPLAERVADAADAYVTDPDRRFSLIRGGPVSSGVAGACIRAFGTNGIICETTYQDQPLSFRTQQHRAMVNVLLIHIGLIEGDCRDRLAAPKSPNTLQVAVFDGTGTGPSRIDLCRVIEDASDISLHDVGPEQMKAEVLEQFDVLVFPGGSGSKQGNAIGEKGREAVRKYVADGGGIVGICAGAYLCSAHYKWSLDLIDASTFTGSVEIPGKGKKPLWYRGVEADIDMELTPQGERLFAGAGIPRNFVVRYCNGPIISPKDLEALEDYEVLAWFRSENGLWESQEGTMINTPAIVLGEFGKGRVISVSPHPEFTPSLHPIITQAIHWTASASD